MNNYLKHFIFFLISTLCFSTYANGKTENDNSAESSAVEQIKLKPPLSEKDIERLDYYHKEALAALRKGEYQYSALMFEKYLKIKDDNPKIYEYLAPIYIKLNREEDALQALQAEIKIRPNSFNAYFEMGKLYREMGEYKTAIDCFNKSLDIFKTAEAYFQLGLTYERINELDKAKNIYNDIVILDPNHAEANFSLGLLYLRKNDYKNAYDKISRAVEINPNNLNYNLYLQKTKFLMKEKSAEPSIPEPKNN